MKKVKICLAWHDINSTNYGVGALAISHLNLIHEVATRNNIDIQIDTIGFPDAKGMKVRELIEQRLDLKIKHLTLNLKGTLKDFLTFKLGKAFFNQKYDFVFDIGAGDSFADIYGSRRFFFMILTKYLALKAGCKLVISPQTVGPFKNKLYEKIAKHYMQNSVEVFVRDYKSKQYLDSIGVASTEVSDVAFVLPYDKGEKKLNAVGLNVSGLLWNGGYTKKNQFGLSLDYKKLIQDIIQGFLDRGKDVHLIGHVIDDNNLVEDDYRAIQQVKQIFADQENVIVAPKFQSAIEAKSYISTLEFFSGARMHATIGAVSSGVPTIPIAYSRKFSGVFGSINYEYSLDAYKDLETEVFLQQFFKLYDEQREQMQQDAQAALVSAKQRLNKYTQALESLLS